MPFSKATGDLPKIIANQERLYEGSLTFYFRTLFFKSSNIYNPYHNFRHMLHVLWLCHQHADIIKTGSLRARCETCLLLRYSMTLIIPATLTRARAIPIE